MDVYIVIMYHNIVIANIHNIVIEVWDFYNEIPIKRNINQVEVKC